MMDRHAGIGKRPQGKAVRKLSGPVGDQSGWRGLYGPLRKGCHPVACPGLPVVARPGVNFLAGTAGLFPACDVRESP